MKNLRSLRKEKNMSQLNLADFLHISPSTVAQWELGSRTPRLGQILTLCRILNCTPARLLCDDSCNTLPLFSAGRDHSISFIQLPCECADISCHFGVVISENLSPRILQGDICFFELCRDFSPNDVVIALDGEHREKIFMADDSCSFADNVVAVCRFLQRKF